jgi:hypothetical protein
MRPSTRAYRDIITVLSPSWLSGLLAVTIGLVITGGVIITFSFNNTSFQQQLVAWQSTQPTKALTTPDQTLTQNDRPTLAGSWPLLTVWGLVGLLVYALTMAIVRAITNANELRESLNYVNADHHSQIETVTEQLVLRIVSAAILISLLAVFIKQVVPYSITAAHATSSNIISLDGGLYALLSFLMVVLSIHLQTIFFRLSMGKVRVF